jgi:hypothetical protein
MLKTESVGIRLEPALKEALAKAAKDDHRTMASYIVMLLVTHLRDRGYLR